VWTLRSISLVFAQSICSSALPEDNRRPFQCMIYTMHGGKPHLQALQVLPLLLQQLQVPSAEAVQAVDEQLLRCCRHKLLLMVHQQQAHVAQQRQVAAEVLIVLVSNLQR
jgi:hypothetical protein